MDGAFPFHTVLIANRGEIAVHIIATLRQLRMRSAIVYHEVHRAPHSGFARGARCYHPDYRAPHEVVTAICDRMVVLSYGGIIARGRPKEAIAEPAVVAVYLGQRAAARHLVALPS